MNNADCMTITSEYRLSLIHEGFFAVCRSVDGANQYLADDVSGGSSVGIHFKGGKTNRGTR